VAIFLRHEPCPRCGSSDALAIYSDGGSFCFSCGIPSGATTPSFREEEDEEQPLLPSDLSLDFPQEVLNWIKPTGISIHELIHHQYFYSKSTSALVRTFFPGSTRTLHQCSRIRSGPYDCRFGFKQHTKTKSKFYGRKENVYAFSYYGQDNSLQQENYDTRSWKEVCSKLGTQLVIVEDSLSSIKIGRHTCAIPLFGSSISKEKLVKMTQQFEEIIVWLDSDKLNAARQIADRIKLLGKKTKVVYTELDPKYLNASDYLWNLSRNDQHD